MALTTGDITRISDIQAKLDAVLGTYSGLGWATAGAEKALTGWIHDVDFLMYLLEAHGLAGARARVELPMYKTNWGKK